jgi:hypothetical protein
MAVTPRAYRVGVLRSRLLERLAPGLRSVPGPEWELRYRPVHGYRRAYRMAGSGPALLLIHGIGDDSSTWAPVLSALGRHHTVIAPDLLGHGGSDKPRADYSIAAYANGMRDLLGVLDVDGSRWWATRWAVGWRCSSPTSSPSAPSVSCWWGRAAPGAR